MCVRADHESSGLYNDQMTTFVDGVLTQSNQQKQYFDLGALVNRTMGFNTRVVAILAGSTEEQHLHKTKSILSLFFCFTRTFF